MAAFFLLFAPANCEATFRLLLQFRFRLDFPSYYCARPNLQKKLKISYLMRLQSKCNNFAMGTKKITIFYHLRFKNQRRQSFFFFYTIIKPSGRYSKLRARGKDFQNLMFSKKSFDLVLPFFIPKYGDL